MALRFLNTNIILRHPTQDHDDLSPRATALVRRIESGTLTVRTSDTVVFETVFTLQRFYRVPQPEIRAVIEPLLRLRGMRLQGKRRYQRTFEIYVSLTQLSFADCYHVAVMESLGLTELLSFDVAMSRVTTIVRREPDINGLLV